MTKISSEQRILSAARRLFFERGFENVSTDLLAKEASVSKASIYRIFDNMTDVLRCVTEREVDKFRETVPPSVETQDDLRNALTQYGQKLLTFLNEPETLKFSCLMHESARKNPEIGQTFYKAAFVQSQNDLAALFSRAEENGLLRKKIDPLEVAEDMISLFEGFGVVRVQFGVTEIAYEDVDKRVSRAVSTILAAYC